MSVESVLAIEHLQDGLDVAYRARDDVAYLRPNIARLRVSRDPRTKRPRARTTNAAAAGAELPLRLAAGEELTNELRPLRRGPRHVS